MSRRLPAYLAPSHTASKRARLPDRTDQTVHSIEASSESCSDDGASSFSLSDSTDHSSASSGSVSSNRESADSIEQGDSSSDEFDISSYLQETSQSEHADTSADGEDTSWADDTSAVTTLSDDCASGAVGRSTSRRINPCARVRPVSEVADVEALHARLVEVLECPVCFDPITPPIHQCEFGHSICHKCGAKITNCPTCKRRMSKGRNWTLERLTENLKYPCRNAEYGCPFTGYLADRVDHVSVCPLRPFSCPLRKCVWTGAQVELVPHLSSCHTHRFLEGSVHELDVNVAFGDFNTTTTWAIHCFGQVFRFTVLHESTHVKVAAAAFLVDDNADDDVPDYSYSVTIKGSHGRRSSFTREVHNHNTAIQRLMSSRDCFVLSQCDLLDKGYYKSDGVVRFYLELDQLTN